MSNSTDLAIPSDFRLNIPDVAIADVRYTPGGTWNHHVLEIILPNGYGISILAHNPGNRGGRCYSDKSGGRYEVGLIGPNGHLTSIPGISDDWPDRTVIGWQTPAEIADILRKVSVI